MCGDRAASGRPDAGSPGSARSGRCSEVLDPATGEALARVAAAGQVALILWGWALAQYPYVVPPTLTIAQAAAPAITLTLVLWALAAGALVLCAAFRHPAGKRAADRTGRCAGSLGRGRRPAGAPRQAIQRRGRPDRDGGAALPAGRRGRHDPLGRREAAGEADRQEWKECHEEFDRKWEERQQCIARGEVPEPDPFFDPPDLDELFTSETKPDSDHLVS